jgi:two-component system chemotaxis response regulator CheB
MIQGTERRKIKVMIVEDSAVVRELLTHIIEQDGRFVVAAAVASAEEALRVLGRVAPDVISLDIRLPGMNGLDATLQIMATRPTPIVVVAANVESDELNIAMNALRAGALTVVEKPVGVTHEDYRALADDLCRQIAIMSQVRVLRQARRRHPGFGSGAGGGTAVDRSPARSAAARPAVLGIVASTGGPNAVSQLLAGLGRGFPLPTLLVQHITPAFLDGFISWLNSVSPLPVAVAADGERPRPGHVYLPPADRHLEIVGGVLRMVEGPEVSTQRPSGTVLFRSMARDLGPRGIGVLLTGMGDDGAAGLLEMRRAGALTIAEDASTAVIYGMPRVAAETGAAAETLPLGDIAGRIAEAVGVVTEESGA